MSPRPVMPIPLATKLSIFEARNEHYSNWQLLLDKSLVCSLCLCVFIGNANTVCAIKRGVPAIVFDYPRHSGATDKGMPNRPSIFAYLVFRPREDTVKGITRPMKISPWRGPGRNLAYKMKTRRRRPSRIRTCLEFIRTDSICNQLGKQSRDPTFAYKRLGGRS
jgi:hypothetical protein